jgi:phenylacetic acid degradation protein paaN
MLLFEKHKETLDKATKAVYSRSYYAAYNENPKAYAEDGLEKAKEWFGGILGNEFTELLQNNPDGFKGNETSPYTQELLDIKYPAFSAENLVGNARATLPEWRHASPETRAALLIESLERIQRRFFDIALATMHTSGQPYMMSFQASGPHANDRALEAIALGYDMLKRFPGKADWEKPMGKFDLKVKKSWKAIGRGVGLVIGCSTFPVWNTLPGVYASLVTGNPVIVKPHPGAILPIAIVVAEIQKTLLQNSFSTNIIQLAVDNGGDPITKQLANHPDVKIIDYTGGTSFGDYIESIPAKVTFTEKAGVNSVILDSVNLLEPVMQNLAFAASLYSGQMCTAPQNIFVPEGGIKAGEEIVPFTTVAQALADAVKAIATHPKMGPGVLGAIQSIDTLQRIVNTKGNLEGREEVILDSMAIQNEEFPNARTASPMIIRLEADDINDYAEECFGPVIYIIRTRDTKQSVELARKLALAKGAISCGAYTTDEKVKQFIGEQMEEAFTPVAFNLTGQIWMNQNAAFSDFHVTGGNPAGNATFTDPAYVVRRFVWVGHKEGVA